MARVYIEGRNRKADYRRIVSWVNKWRKRLHVTDWTVYIRLKNQQHKDGTYLASMDTNEQYRSGTISIYPHMWELPLKEQERTIVHELAHLSSNKVSILVDRLLFAELAKEDEIVDTFEILAEWITNVAWDAYEK